MANIIGAYIPYVFVPIIYLATLTIVASIVTAISNSNVDWDTPLSIIQLVKGV